MNYLLRDNKNYLESASTDRLLFNGTFVKFTYNDILYSDSNINIANHNIYISYIESSSTLKSCSITNFNTPECNFISKIENNALYFSKYVEIVDIKIGTSETNLIAYLPFDYPTRNTNIINIVNKNNLWHCNRISNQYFNNSETIFTTISSSILQI